MLSTFKSFFLAALVLGVLSGCSSTDTQPDPAPVDTTPETDSGAGVDSSGVDTYEDPMETIRGVATVFYFEFDSAILSSEARVALSAHAEYIKDQSVEVRLEGHADERGSREYNMALGERRAKAVADYLKLQGVSSSLIETVSYGEERPVMMGSSESSWAKNRRVELSY